MKHAAKIALALLLGMTAMLSACDSASAPEQTTPADTEPATQQATETPTETEAEPTTEPVTEIATEEVTIVPNDGKPKKFFTLSFDDGITQDLKVIEILKKYDVKCISFNINTGLYGANWDWVGPAIGDPSIPHQRFTEEELKTGIYDGYEVLVHTLNHPSLKNYDKRANQIKKEVGKDADNIEELTGVRPVGMAWPGGDTEYTDKTIELVLENTDIRFARGTTSTYSFALPEYFMKWMPTCSIVDPRCLTLAQEFIDAECTEDMLFYVWGHAYELDLNGGKGYETFEQLVKMMSEAEGVYLVTNTEFYTVYKDQIPSWKQSE
ncbi:MAG: polysaccharide deacetylase family protein [Clostridia bacterium]|nr:polysaccharide deacetylase family protein [Clostridia bacterium]